MTLQKYLDEKRDDSYPTYLHYVAFVFHKNHPPDPKRINISLANHLTELHELIQKIDPNAGLRSRQVTALAVKTWVDQNPSIPPYEE